METTLKIKDLSSYLKISVSQIRTMVRENKIPHYRIGNRIFFRQSKINLWIEEKEKQTSKNRLNI